MILHARLTKDSIGWFKDYFRVNNWESPTNLNFEDDRLELEFDTNNKIATYIAVRAFCYNIATEQDFKKFQDLLEGKIVARFNEGKVDFTYIDFYLFELLRNKCCRRMNNITNTQDELLDFIINYTNKVVFCKTTENPWLCDLQLYAYQLAAVMSNVKLKTYSESLSLTVFESMAKVLEFGAKKYERDNWRKQQLDYTSAAASLYRHVQAIQNGEEVDKESGICHSGHIMCNVMFLTYNHLNR